MAVQPSKKPRRLRKVQVSLVSLVSKGANQQPALLKSEDGALCIHALVKADLEGLLHTLVYVPDKVDGQDEWMSAEDIRFAAHYHMRSGAQLDLHHDFTPLSKQQAYPVEHFILQGQDARFPQVDREGLPVKHNGAWGMIVKIEDPALLALAKAGNLNEVSLYCAEGCYEASLEQPPVAKSAEGNPATPKKHMDEKLAEALAKMLAPFQATLAELTKSVAELKAPPIVKVEVSPPTPTVDADGWPIFKGSMSNQLDVLKHTRALEDMQLGKEFEGCMKDAQALRELTKCQVKLRELRKAEDAQLGIVAAPTGGSLRKQLLGAESGTPTHMAPSGPAWMQPSDKTGHEEILKSAGDFLKSHNGRVKGQESKKGE